MLTREEGHENEARDLVKWESRNLEERGSLPGSRNWLSRDGRPAGLGWKSWAVGREAGRGGQLGSCFHFP